ncbi:MAG: Crp/Fnr family transcriptional regulator [Burkholderiaceae bacterium]|jgi:CRP-like cAMP-binding protein|nr:Crp/Fnr family transcriptional regulator [Burkholderiales bacterium]MBP8053500.1 Crp/Fnr family transcriptional regulator [Burkholderiaceae bacterium]
MKVDPAVVQIFAENVRADIIRRPAGLNLDAAIVQKIAAKVQVFRGMTHDCLMSTLAMAEHMPVKAGDVVFNEGVIGSSFYVLIAGEVVIEKVRNGQVVPLARLVPGECFGEMALVGSPLRSATVRAVRDSVCMRFDRERVDAYSDSAHIIYRNIARILSARLDTSSELLTELTLRGSEAVPPEPGAP